MVKKFYIFLFMILITKTLFAAAPVINSILPVSGYNDEFTNLTINGQNFDSTSKAAISAGGLYIKGTYNTPESSYGVCVNGGYAFIADGYSSLQIIDISDPASLILKGSIDTPGKALGVYVNGNYAYVADYDQGLQIIDISDPASPILTGNIDTPGSAYGVYVNGNYAYVADWNYGLQIIDISIPSSPVLKGTYNTPGSARGIYVQGNYAYVADFNYGLQIIDVGNSESPVLRGTCATPGYAEGVYVNGNYAYIADYNYGLQIIDICTPSSPVLKGTYNTPGSAYGVYVKGNYAYIADGGSGIEVIDITDPNVPFLKGTCNLPGNAQGVYVSGNYAYAAGYGLQIIDLVNLLSPSLKGTYNTPGSAYGVFINNNYAYVADHNYGLQIIDISDPLNSVFKGTYNTPGYALGVFQNGNYVYIADESAGLQIIDISDPLSPSLKGTYNTPGYAIGVYVNGNYAYIADNEYGLQIIDISDPSSPILKGTYNTPGYAYGVYVNGNYAYVADYEYGLQVIDISNPAIPILKGAYNTPGRAYGVYVIGVYAYVADYDYGLQIIDVSVPASPILKGTYNTPGYARNIYVNNNYAYIADVYSLQIIDVINPAFPSLKGIYNTMGNAYGVYMNGNYVFVADYDYGLQIIQKISAGSECGNIINIDSASITADVLTRLSPGKYNITVTNSNGEQGILHNCFEVQQGITANNAPIIDTIGNKIVDEYETLNITITGSDLDSDIVFYEASDLPFGADYNTNTRIFNWTPNYLQQGIYNVIFGIYDGELDGYETLNITVNDILPAVTMISSETTGVNPLIINFTANASYSNGTIVNYEWDLDGNGSYETATTGNTRIYTYNSVGTYNAKVRVTDNDSETATDIETIVVINQPPAANDDSATTNEDTQTIVNVLLNDNDLNGDPLTITAVTQGVKGTAADNGNGTITYVPNTNVNGTDSFTYTISDGSGGTDTGTVNINITAINDAPTADNDTTSTNEDTQKVISVLANDTDADGDTLTITAVTQGVKGTAANNGNGTITYVPNTNVNGTDSFTYTISDGSGGTDTGTVNVNISAINDAPAVILIASETTGVNPVTINFTASASDLDGVITNYEWDLNGDGSYETSTTGNIRSYTYNTIGTYNAKVRVTDNDSETAIDTKTIIVTNVAPAVMLIAGETTGIGPLTVNFTANAYDSNGTIVNYEWDLDGDGSYETATTGNIRSYTFNASGTYNAEVRVTDNDSATAIDTKAIVIINQPPAANDDNVITHEDTQVIVTVLSNDIDLNIDSLSITAVTQGLKGTIADNGNGTITYVPNADVNGTDSFTYTISDGKGGTDTGTVNVTITAINDAPAANNDTAITNEDTQIIINILANDIDIDGDTLTITAVTQGLKGTTVDNGNGTITYVPNANVNGADSFTYTISDGNGGIDTGTVNVTVTALNDAPVVTLTANGITGVVPFTVYFTARANDIDGVITKYEWDLDGNGTYEISTTENTLSYIYNTAGINSAKVRVIDNNSAEAIAIKIITVNEPHPYLNNLPFGNIDISSPGSSDRVDGHDLYELSKVFGTQPGDLNWNILADLDGNRIIDGNDLVILAGNFGKKINSF